jgi:hypothetical protein
MWNNRFFKTVVLVAYIVGALWYAYDAWVVYKAVHSTAPYPFMLDMNNLTVTLFSLGGAIYWFTFGLDRSGSFSSIMGYLAAGAHVLIFAYQVWLGPMMWALESLG